jgi:hypothetical protein
VNEIGYDRGILDFKRKPLIMESNDPTFAPKERTQFFEHWLANARDFSRQIELRPGAPIGVDAILAADREKLEKRGSPD